MKVIVDRTMDIVRAATANRLELGGEMIMDETATMAAFLLAKATAVSTATVTDTASSGMEVEVEVAMGERQARNGEDDMDGEGEGEGEEGGRSRRRRDEDDAPDADRMVEVNKTSCYSLLFSTFRPYFHLFSFSSFISTILIIDFLNFFDLILVDFPLNILATKILESETWSS